MSSGVSGAGPSPVDADAPPHRAGGGPGGGCGVLVGRAFAGGGPGGGRAFGAGGLRGKV